jgi:hypothetical protein
VSPRSNFSNARWSAGAGASVLQSGFSRRQSWRCDASVVPTVLVRAGTSLVPLAGGDFETVGKTPAGWALGGGHIVTADDASCTQPARTEARCQRQQPASADWLEQLGQT